MKIDNRMATCMAHQRNACLPLVPLSPPRGCVANHPLSLPHPANLAAWKAWRLALLARKRGAKAAKKNKVALGGIVAYQRQRGALMKGGTNRNRAKHLRHKKKNKHGVSVK